MTLQLSAYAKINLFLDITGRRPDGYHDILSLMQTVSLCDRITVSVGETVGEITLSCDTDVIPCDGRNLAYRAAEAFYRALGERRETHITIEKHIPISAGLAGGSTDAAAVLRGLNQLCGMPFSENELCAIGKTLGADIPFCIVGGTAEVRGIGEILVPVSDVPELFLVVVKDGEGVSTPEAYRALDGMFDGFDGRYLGGTAEKNAYSDLRAALGSADLTGISKHIYNIFEGAVLGRHTRAAELKEFLLANGATGAMMSGSGPSVFGLFKDRSSAEAAAMLLNRGKHQPIAFAVMPVSRETVARGC